MAFSQPLFQIKGTALKPSYSNGSSENTTVLVGASAANALVTALATAGVFGSSVIDFTSSSAANARYLRYSAAGGNGPSSGALSVLIRIVPLWTGSPATRQPLVQIGNATDGAPLVVVNVTTTGKIYFEVDNGHGIGCVAATSVNAFSFTNGTPTDIMVTWDGTAAAGSVKFYQEGSLVESQNPSSAYSYWNQKAIGFLQLGYDYTTLPRGNNFYLNELCVFDSVQPAYAPRTGFVTSIQANGDTIPAASDVRAGVASGLVTGSCAVPTASSVLSGVAVDATVGTVALPTTAQVQHGVTFGASGALLGTYRGYDLWQAVAANHLYNGDVRLQDGVTITGTDQGFDFNDLVDPATLKIGTRIANHGIFVTGTYDGSDRWSYAGDTNVAAGITSLVNGVTHTGTRLVVTNVFQSATLVAQSNSATLTAHE